MKKFRKHKLGFSLVEMVLVLAIICLLGGVIGGICVAISNSFITTYNIDDSSDYAMLFGRGFENSFLAKTQKPTSNTISWYVNNSAGYPTLRVKEGSADTAVFEPQFLGTGGGNWDILMYYKWEESSERVLYRVLLRDRRNNTGFTYFYEGGFWVPRYKDRNAYNSSNNIISVTGEPMNSTSLSSHSFSTNQFSSSQLDGSFKNIITFSK